MRTGPRVGLIAVCLLWAGSCGVGDPPGARTPVATSPPFEVAAAQPDYESFRLTLPMGDPAAGREAFVTLRCTTCHTVADDTELATPTSDSPGPELGPNFVYQAAGDIATSVLAPSHSISIRKPARTQTRGADVLSPMADYSEAMTVRQLLDLVAYLESTRPKE